MLNKVQALVDNVEHLTFKEALDTIIEKEKSLIHRAFANAKECESNGDDVWCSMLQEAENDTVDVLEAFKIYILYYQGIKSDNVFQAIMKTLEIATKSGMNFDEALNFAVQDKKSLILKAIRKSTTLQPGLLYT